MLPGMEQEALVADIEARAREAGVTIRELCKKAKVWPGTVSRWKASEKNPNPIGPTFATVRKLNDALAELSQERAA